MKYIFILLNVFLIVTIILLYYLGICLEYDTGSIRDAMFNYSIKEIVFLYLVFVIVRSFWIKDKDVKYINWITAIIAFAVLWHLSPYLSPF